jgi:hypothetical protein
MRLFLSAAALLLASSAAMADCGHPEMIQAVTDDVSATVPSGTVYCYQVAAVAGQQVTLAVASDANDVVFAVFAPGWQVNCSAAGDCDVTGDQLSDDEVTTWSEIAANNGNYLIVIDNSRSDADYRLNVGIK